MTYISTPCTPACRPAKPQLSLLSRIGLQLSVMRQRRKLAALDARALDDIGVSRAEAEAEAGRGFWSAPDHWTR